MAAAKIIRVAGGIGEGADTVYAVARNISAAANKTRIAAYAVLEALYDTEGAARAVFAVCTAGGFLGGLSYLCYAKTAAFFKYLFTPISPQTQPRSQTRLQNQLAYARVCESKGSRDAAYKSLLRYQRRHNRDDRRLRFRQ